MPDEVLAKYIEQYVAAQPTPVVEFVWHGGEPTLLGLDFFRRVVELQQPFRGRKEIRNAADRYVLEGGSEVVIPGAPENGALSLAQQVELVEKALIEQALTRQGGNVQRVIETLGVPKKTLYDKLHRHGIALERFRSGGN